MADPLCWQPIATAPKDQNILLTNGKEVSEGGWLTAVEQGADYDGQWADPGWWTVSISYKHVSEITHWMPLPEAPK